MFVGNGLTQHFVKDEKLEIFFLLLDNPSSQESDEFKEKLSAIKG